MKKRREIALYISLLILSLFLSRVTQAQEISLGQQIDDITYQWDIEEVEMETYDGLQAFCSSKEYRKGKIDLLNEIHHLDSILYKRALVASRRSKQHIPPVCQPAQSAHSVAQRARPGGMS